MKLSRIATHALACLGLSLAVVAAATADEARVSAMAATAPTNSRKVVRQTSITISKETTLITAPLTAEGYPDYVEYLDRKAARGVTPQSNAVVLLWQVVGPKEVPASTREEYFRRLGMPVPAETGPYLLEPDTYAQNAGLVAAGDDGKLLNQFSESYRRPWTRDEFPILAKWLTASQRPLQLAVEMSHKPHHYTPLVSHAKSFRMVMSVLPTGVQMYRPISRALLARAMLRLGEKNLEGAVSDIMAVRRLSRLVDQGPHLVDALVAISVASMASDAEAAVMHFGRSTRLAIAQFRRQRDAIAPLRNMADRLDESERMTLLDGLCGVQRHGPSAVIGMDAGWPDELETPGRMFSKVMLNCCVDWNAALTASNEVFDRYVAAARIQNCRKRNRAIRAYDENIRQLTAAILMLADHLPLMAWGGPEGRKLGGKYLAGVGISLLMGPLGSVLQAGQRIETIERRGAIVMALADYRADHGMYPAELADLVPKYIKAVPRDTFTEAEFHYERTDKGFRIYSVGVNGIDEFGRNLQLDDPTGDDWLLTMPPKPRKQ